MRMIEIAAQENGAHRNQTTSRVEMNIPDGWAVVPEDMETENFPFGEITAEEIDGVMTVTGWTAGTIPEPEPEPYAPTIEERTAALEEAMLILMEGNADV